MIITDEHVALLRAHLAGQRDGLPSLADLGDEDAAAYAVLVAAAFFEAVDRQFAGKATVADVIEFVGDLRSRSAAAAEQLDGSATERLIRHSLGDDVSIADIDGKTKVATQIIVSNVLVAEGRIEGEELERFLSDVRTTAQKLAR